MKTKNSFFKLKNSQTPSAAAFFLPFLLMVVLGCYLHYCKTLSQKAALPPAPFADLALLAERPDAFIDSTITIEGFLSDRCDLPTFTCYTLTTQQAGKQYIATVFTDYLPDTKTGAMIEATVVVRDWGGEKMVLIERNRKISYSS